MFEAKRHRNLLGLATVTVAALIIYWPTYQSIAQIWLRSDTFAHGFLIVPISIFLIGQKRIQLKQQTFIFEPLVVPFLVVTVLVWSLGQIANITVIQQFSAVAIFPLMVWLFLGRDAVCTIRFPLLYLFFAVPFGEFLVPVLQDFTAVFTVKALRLVGIPVYWEGRYFFLPEGSYVVAEACSGVRYLIASVALGTLFAYLNFVSLSRRIFFILLSLIVPVIANGLRAFGIVLISNFTDQQFGKGIDHLIYGWFFFGVVMFLLFWFGYRMRENISNTEIVISEIEPSVCKERSEYYQATILIISSIILLSGPVLVSLQKNIKNNVIRQSSLPSAINGWTGPMETDIQWRSNYNSAHSQNLKLYKKNDNKVYLRVSNYSQQSNDQGIVSADNKLIDTKLWRRVSESKYLTRSGEDGELLVNEITIKSNSEYMLLWQWYIVNGESVSNPVLAKIYEFKTILTGQIYGAKMVVVAAKYLNKPDDARLKLTVFIQDMAVAVMESSH